MRFERFVDDAVIHVSANAERARHSALEDRMVEVGLRLHPDKSRVAYCKDDKGAALISICRLCSWFSCSVTWGADKRRAHV